MAQTQEMLTLPIVLIAAAIMSLCFVMNGAMPHLSIISERLLCHYVTVPLSRNEEKCRTLNLLTKSFCNIFCFDIITFYLGYFHQKSNKVNLLHDSRKCCSNNTIISVSPVRQWHHYQEYQWPSPEPSALIMRNCLLIRAPIVADKVLISRHLSYIISRALGKIEMCFCLLACSQTSVQMIFILFIIGFVSRPG